MNKGEFLLLILYTTIIVTILSFSYVSLFFNIMQFIWILIHFTLVVVITSFLLKKATNQEIKKEIAWISFGALFILSGIAGLYLFPTEEISRLIMIEPGMLIVSLLAIFSIMKLKDSSLLNNKFLFYILVTLMSIFIIYSIFLPTVNGLFAEESISQNVLKSDVETSGGRIFIPIAETTITNPTPIFLPVPVNQIYYCLYHDGNDPYYYNSAFESKGYSTVEEAWFDIEGSGWKTYRMLAEKSFRVSGDAAYTGYNYYQYTDKRPLIYKVPPFKTVTIKQAVEFNGIEEENRIGYFVSDTNLIRIVERGKEKMPGGNYPCQESKVVTSIDLR